MRSYRWFSPPCHTFVSFPPLLCAICISCNTPTPKQYQCLQRNRVKRKFVKRWCLYQREDLQFYKKGMRTCEDKKNSVDHSEEGASEAAEEGHAGVDGLQPWDFRYILYGLSRVGTNQPAQKTAHTQWTQENGTRTHTRYTKDMNATPC